MDHTAPASAETAPAESPSTGPRLTVRGEARLDVAPELARLTVAVTARGTDRRTTLDDLTRRNDQVLALVRGYGDAVQRTESGPLTVRAELNPHRRGEKVRAHHGRASLTVETGDFTVLGELVTRLADLDLTRVDGPWWSLAPDSPVHRTARQNAVRDAVRRAHEYAEALGGRLTALLDLADEGTEQYAVEHHDHAVFARAAARPEAADEPTPVDLEPRRQTVHARVTARFTMTPADLSPNDTE
ncbi:SIMPL domain-containing protein [Streptomyces sp. NPDC060194]|uniref:SIMPL domain-containing protein n=1 Tax=Streptomyces sp. NPDC060194 TaxID=3347069 RepID=UPI0036548E59